MARPPSHQHDALNRVRRFYKAVTVEPADGGFTIALDGRTPRTPAKARLVLPTEALAQLVAGEWEAQGEFIVADAMPATRLANTAIDRVSGLRAETAAEVGRYAGSDLLTYFAAHPAALVEEETARWGPVLDWAAQDLGVRLHRVVGVIHEAQDPEALSRVEALALELDDFGLTGLTHAAGLFGSAILALAVQRGQLGGQAAFDLAHLDDAFQARQWGEDAEAVQRAQGILREALVIEQWFIALRRT